MNKLFLPIIVLSLFSSCSKNDGVVDPIIEGNTTDVIFFSSFELDRNPSTSGWAVYPTPPSPLVSFSSDVPYGGGFWSINLHRGADRDSQAEVGFETSLSMSDTVESYIVSFWAKGKGMVSLTVSDVTIGWYLGSDINTSSWTFFADTLDRHESRYNKLDVYFSSSTNDSLPSNLCLDNVKIFVRKPNLLVLANQSLKLTEPAIDDFARAQQSVTIGQELARAD